jgi:hypothetical protein
MNQKKRRTLKLNRETIRTLDGSNLATVRGGGDDVSILPENCVSIIRRDCYLKG